MLKKKGVIICIILVMLTFSLGCVENPNFGNPKTVKYVSINLSSNINLSKEIPTPFLVKYTSTYSEAQIVILNLSTNDNRLGISSNESGPYQQYLSYTDEVGRNFPISKSFYVKTINPYMPYGEYDIYVDILGVKSGDEASSKMVVKLGYKY